VAYSTERKASVIAKMLPPHNMPLGRLSQEEGISKGRCHDGGLTGRRAGKLLPDARPGPRAGRRGTSSRR
jgi:hypothetical protein